MRTPLGFSLLVALVLMSGCSGEECQSHGENCTQAFKQQQYGRTDIQCCTGQCTEGIENGVLVCQ
jgi:hypothetical protein